MLDKDESQQLGPSLSSSLRSLAKDKQWAKTRSDRVLTLEDVSEHTKDGLQCSYGVIRAISCDFEAAGMHRLTWLLA